MSLSFPGGSPARVFVACVGAAVLGAALPASAALTQAQDTPAPAQTAPASEPFAPYFYPLSRPQATPHIVIDVSDAPEARAFADNAQKLVEQWFPLVCQFLATQDYTPPKTLTLVFKKDLRVPAYATGSGKSAAAITISNKWITQHPDDYGMVIHEMTHVIQSYPQGGDKPGWLVEGIADYIRFYRYEPDVPRPRVNPQKAAYQDSYRTTAAFLAFVSGKYHRGLVSRLDQALRRRSYRVDLWKTITGKEVDVLWAEFLQTLPPRAAPK